MLNLRLLNDKAWNFNENFIIAIDGPSASGKSHLSQQLSQHLNLKHVESGIFYRIFAKNCMEKNIPPEEEAIIISGLLNIMYEMFQQNQDSNSVLLRDEKISLYASQIAIIAQLRKKINAYLQQLVLQHPRIVMEGRDIGKVVLPKADLKIFLTADLHSRALRRKKQFSTKGIDLDFLDISSKLECRDMIDTKRSVDPLSADSSSVVIDSTNLTLDNLVSKILSLIKGDNE